MTTNKPEAAHLADARAEFEKWASTHFFLQEEDTIVDDSDEYISVDMQLAWEAWYASRAAPDVTQLVEALTELCDEIDKHEIHAAISKTSISWFKRKARKALAAYRKQGGGE